MSSRVFQANTGHSEDRPQLCGLSGRKIQKDDWCLYLVIKGSDARPEYQIKLVSETDVEREVYIQRYRQTVKRTVTQREYGMDDGREYRSVFGGWRTNPETGKREKSFEWQEKINGAWHPIEVWSRLVLAEVAEALGYDVRKDKKGKWQTTRAKEGDRCLGNEHTVADQEINAMEELARAACSDEELGIVAPGAGLSEREKAELTEVNETLELLEELRAESTTALDEDAENAALLGMSLEDYRKVQSSL